MHSKREDRKIGEGKDIDIGVSTGDKQIKQVKDGKREGKVERRKEIKKSELREVKKGRIPYLFTYYEFLGNV